MPQANRLKLPSASARQQAEGKILWNDARTVDGADFFTLGYTGRKIEDIRDALLAAGVRSLVDIRQTPVSMYRPELSKNNLRRQAHEWGLQYYHLPQLGVPRDIRAKAVDTGSRDIIWHWYDEFVVDQYLGNLHWFLNAVEHPAALMCVELDPRECHRHRLFQALEAKGLSGFDI